MTEPLTLTFAEIAFILAACPQQAAEVRRDLRINAAQDSPVLARAGLASLLARGLCAPVLTGGEGGGASDGDGGNDATPDVKPGPEITAVAAALSTSHTHTVATGWRGKRADVMHLYSSDALRLAFFPYLYGRFAVEALDAAEPLSGPLARFLDAHLLDGRETAFIAESTTAGQKVGLAVAVDAAGTWSVSDTGLNPDRAERSSRDRVLSRMAELFTYAGAASGRAA